MPINIDIDLSRLDIISILQFVECFGGLELMSRFFSYSADAWSSIHSAFVLFCLLAKCDNIYRVTAGRITTAEDIISPYT